MSKEMEVGDRRRDKTCPRPASMRVTLSCPIGRPLTLLTTKSKVSLALHYTTWNLRLAVVSALHQKQYNITMGRGTAKHDAKTEQNSKPGTGDYGILLGSNKAQKSKKDKGERTKKRKPPGAELLEEASRAKSGTPRIAGARRE